MVACCPNGIYEAINFSSGCGMFIGTGVHVAILKGPQGLHLIPVKQNASYSSKVPRFKCYTHLLRIASINWRQQISNTSSGPGTTLGYKPYRVRVGSDFQFVILWKENNCKKSYAHTTEGKGTVCSHVIKQCHSHLGIHLGMFVEQNPWAVPAKHFVQKTFPSVCGCNSNFAWRW